jgi:predicted choloylglycine hydrolase
MNDKIKVDEIEVKAKTKPFYSFSYDGDVKCFKSAFSGNNCEIFVRNFAHK